MKGESTGNLLEKFDLFVLPCFSLARGRGEHVRGERDFFLQKKYLWFNMLRYKTLSCVCVFLWFFSVQHVSSIGVDPKSKRSLRKTLKNYSASKKGSSKSNSSSSLGKKGKSHSEKSGSGVVDGEKNEILYTLPEPKAFQSATMVEVEDGDTIRVILKGSPFTVSLYGIDSPERTQPHGMKAVQAITRLLKRKGSIKLQIYDKDRMNRRCQAVVSVGKKNINEFLVKGGHAWVRREYCYESFCADWLSSQNKAKAAKRGLWSYPERIAPWVWRSMPPERRDVLQRGYSPVENGLRSRYGKDTTIIGR